MSFMGPTEYEPFQVMVMEELQSLIFVSFHEKIPIQNR